MKVREFPAPLGATRKQRDLLTVGVLLNSGLRGARLVRQAGLHPARTLGIARMLRCLRISPAALVRLIEDCEPGELPVALTRLIKSRRWDQKARGAAARRGAKGGAV